MFNSFIEIKNRPYISNRHSLQCMMKWYYWSGSWSRHQMETFSALQAICAGNSPVPGEFPTQRPVTRGFDVFFDLRLNKRLSKQSWGCWFETPSRPLWRHRNVNGNFSNGTVFASRHTGSCFLYIEFYFWCQYRSKHLQILTGLKCLLMYRRNFFRENMKQ